MHSLTHIAVFLRVVDTGSFTAAARQLGMSKPTVSKQIALLEKHLGVCLLNRTTWSLGLTEMGAKYYAHCRSIMAEVETAEAEVLHSSGAPRGRLRVSAPADFGGRCLAPALPEFIDLYPEIELDLSLGNRHVDLISEGYDLAVRITRGAPASLAAIHLAACTHLVCAAPAYCRRRGRPLSAVELAGHECLLYAGFGSGQSWRLDGPGGPETVKVSGRFRANSGDALRQALLAGLGVALMPTFMVAEDLAEGRLCDVLPDHRETSYSVLAVHTEDGGRSPKVRAFVDFLQARLGAAPRAETALPMDARAAAAPG